MAERQEPTPDLPSLFEDAGLDGEYWGDIFAEELEISATDSVQLLNSKDIEKLLDSVRYPWEQKALEKVLNINDDTEVVSLRDEGQKAILVQQTQLKDILEDLNSFSQSDKVDDQTEVAQIGEQLRKVLAIPPEQWAQLCDTTSLKSYVTVCESYLSDIDVVLSNGEQLTPSEVLVNASGGLALKGIFQGKIVEAKQIILSPPKNVTLRGSAMAQVDKTEEYLSKEHLEKFLQTLDEMGYSVAANVKVGLWGFGGNVTEENEEESPETEQCSFLSQLKYTVVPTATCELDRNELSLSPEVLTEIQELERYLRECNDVVDVRKECEDFFNTYGTHVNVGPLHFGGVSKSVATYSSETMSETSTVRSLLNRALSERVSSGCVGGEIGLAGSDSADAGTLLASGGVEKDNEESKVVVAHSRTGGPQGVSDSALWKRGLTIQNNTWALIDWGNSLVGIWDLLQNHTQELIESHTLASTLKNVWQNLNGETTDFEFRTNELVDMVKRWISDEMFSTKCKLYLEMILEVFHHVENEANGLNYWLTKHVANGPLDQFLAQLVEMSDQLPKENLPVMRHWVRELMKPSPPESFFGSDRLLKWVQMTQESEEELDIPRVNAETIPELLTTLQAHLLNTQQSETGCASNQIDDDITAKVVTNVSALLSSLPCPKHVLFLRAHLLNLGFDEVDMVFHTSPSVEKLQKFLDDAEAHWHEFESHVKREQHMEAESFLIHLLLTSSHFQMQDQELEKEFAEIVKDVRQTASAEVNQLLDKYAVSPYNWSKLTEGTKRLASGDLTGLEEGPIDLPRLQQVLDTMPPQDTRNTERKKKKSKKKQIEKSYKDLLGQLGLSELYPNLISLQHATEIRACPDTLKVCDLPWKLIRMLVRLDSRARDIYLDEMAREQADNHAFKLDLCEYDKESDESKPPPNPMDVLLATFSSCDGILQQIIAHNLFLCKLAIPFLYPVGTPGELVFSLWALRAIIVQYQGASRDTVDTPVTDEAFPIITFVRLGNSPVSKSRLLNEVLTGGSHETFYSSKCHKRTEKRKLAEGTLECSWFLPAFKEKDMLPNVTLFLNLRGDGSASNLQMNLVNKVSSLVVVVANVENIAEVHNRRTFSKICKTGKKVVLILTSKCKVPDMKIAQREWQSFVTQIGQDTLQGIQLILTFKKHMNDSDIKIELQTMLPKLLEESSNFSLEEVAELCRKAGIRVDENSPACRKGKKVAHDVMKQMEGRHLVECKRHLLPLQGKTWQEYSKLLKQHHRAGGNESSVSQHKIQKKMMTLRRKQVDMCNNLTPFITSFLQTILNVNREDRLFFLQWMKLLLDTKSRQNLPELHRRYYQIWDEFHRAKSLSGKGKLEMTKLREEVDQAEQNIAEASFGLENIFRELGQIYEAVNESSLSVDRAIKSSLERLPRITAELLLTGTPLELLDGDASSVPLTWVKAVLSEFQTIIGDHKMLVISVLGVQSSGKSTLLNTMFGLKFAVSAGRCTRGAFMQVVRVDRKDIPVEYIAVIDTEGLRAPELAQLKHAHDNELATLAIGLGDMTLINNKGENTAEIKDVLQIAVHAFMRMKIANKSLNVNQGCIFIHQNVPAINAKEKMMQSCQKLQEQLDFMTQEAAESENILDIKSFSQIIRFDVKEHVWYFLDLWHGNPPMAPVNHEYSESTETVKQYMLGTTAKASSLAVSDFALRIQDLWNGILADDFIFSFRNSLEMKAYNAMEEEYCGLMWEIEKSVTSWIQQRAEIKMKKCETVHELESVHRVIVRDFQTLITDKTTSVQQSLTEFFEKSDLQGILIQWEQGKLNALQFVSEQRQIEGMRHLAAIKEGHRVDLLSRDKSEKHEAFLMKRAMALADNLKGKEITDSDLRQEFNKMWTPMIDELMLSQTTEGVKISDVMETILMELYQTDKHILRKELRKVFSSPLEHQSLTSIITLGEIEKEHFSCGTSFLETMKGWVFKQTRTDVARQKMVSATRTILASIDERLSNFCHTDIRFQKAHAEGILRDLKTSIEHFNTTEAKEDNFSVRPSYAVKVAVLVSRRCVEVFSKMQIEYEKTHGIAAKLTSFREKAWTLFSHTVRQSAEEVIAADLFCDQLEDIVESAVESAIPHRVVDEVIIDFSATKHQLIEKMLDELADDESFENYMMYIKHTQSFALKWISKYTDEKMFSVRSRDTLCRYGQLMTEHVKRIMRCVVKGTDCANAELSRVEENKLDTWISTFCDVVDEIPVKFSDLREFSQRNIENFSHLQELILQRVMNIKSTMIDRYCKQNADTVMWKGATPCEQILEKLWGCPAQCPFCGEPCSLTTVDHYEQTGYAHRCLQHRPKGVYGTHLILSDELVTDTCTYAVQSDASFSCNFHKDGNKACSLSRQGKQDRYHPYKDYKPIFPEWDIAPDPTNTTSKYWAWFMTSYLQKLGDYYQCKLPPLSPVWRTITKEQAVEDLRMFH